MSRPITIAPRLVPLLVALGIGGCVAQYPGYYARRPVQAPPVAPPPAQVLFYPAAGQTPEQQDRDRFECYRWAVQQTGFDPAAPPAAPRQRIEVVAAAPPAVNTLNGAATGAILGALVSAPRNAGGGAVVGALAGAMLGAAADASNAEQAERLQQRYDQGAGQQSAWMEQRASLFRRAMSACLDGRGYTVK